MLDYPGIFPLDEVVVPTDPVLVVHGGAWAIPDDMVDAHLNGVRNAARRRLASAEHGRAALDAVEEAVVVWKTTRLSMPAAAGFST